MTGLGKSPFADNGTGVSSPPGAKRITDGTSQSALEKAQGTYLNVTGAGDYELPSLMGDFIMDGTKTNFPNWSFQSRTKQAWFPQRHVDFVGQSSPPPTCYSP